MILTQFHHHNKHYLATSTIQATTVPFISTMFDGILQQPITSLFSTHSIEWDFIFLFSIGSSICSLILDIPFPYFETKTSSNFLRYFSTKTRLSDVLPFDTVVYPHHFQAFRGRLLEQETIFNDEWFNRLEYPFVWEHIPFTSI